LVHLPHQLLAVDLDLVAGLGLELGLAGDLLLAEGVGAALALVQGDGGQEEPGGDESLLVQARLAFARDGAAGEGSSAVAARTVETLRMGIVLLRGGVASEMSANR